MLFTSLPRLAVLGTALAILAGCGGANDPIFGGCPAGDWQRVGARDALAGRGPGYVAEYEPYCAKAGRPVDRAAWAAGHREGLAAYCTERTAYRAGYYRGWFNPGICAVEDRKRLADAEHQGLVRRLMEEDLWKERRDGGGRFIKRP